MQLIEFKTPRLHLRQWRDDDLAPFAQLNSDPRVMEFFPSLLDRSQSDAAVIRARSSIVERGWGFWAAELLGTHQFIGFVGIKPNKDMPFSPCVEIGWRLAVEHWKRGYATEAATGALQIAFEQLKLKEIVSFTPVLNLRSQAVMQRLGMIRHERTFQHPDVPDNSPLKEHVLYRLTQQRWKKLSPRTTVTVL